MSVKTRSSIFNGKKALLLDMNGTFMFGQDRFGDAEDYSIYHSKIGGALASDEINQIIRRAYDYLDVRYVEEAFWQNFPSLKSAITEVCQYSIDDAELDRIISTFAYHELGYIPNTYVTALRRLREKFHLAVVSDIWAPKAAWVDTFEKAGIKELFSAILFSSDNRIVKPSAKNFETALEALGVVASEAIVVGDSIRLDLGGARNAGIDCVLVGGAEHSDAVASYGNLPEICDVVSQA